LGHAERAFPGNKRHSGKKRTRAAQLVWSANGEEVVAQPKERAAVLEQVPVWLVVGALQADKPFLAGLERVLDCQETTDALAARYQRRGSYGFCVLLSLIEGAVQKGAELLVGEAPGTIRNTLRAGLVRNMAPIAFFPAGEVEPSDRQRWRALTRRKRAVETLLSLGADRCLAENCDEPAQGRYCEEHAEHERSPVGVPQLDPDGAQDKHDAAIAAVSDLLGEVGALLAVARPARA
jgi:hypothetical protein